MGSLSVSEIIFLIINGIVIALFTGFILTRNKTKFVTRIWFCRVGLIVSLIVMILGINGMLSDYSSIAISLALYCFISIIVNVLNSDIWLCKECGKKMGLKVLFTNRCPHCHNI